MNITVLNGSPKGKNSITLQTVHYLEKHFPEHQFHIYPVSSRIKTLEKDMSRILDAMEEADLLLFSYPVYMSMPPSQLQHFMELVKSSRRRDFRGIYVTQITTSRHDGDGTAHGYMEENFHDLGMKVLKGLSADRGDLLTGKGREEAVQFLKFVNWQISRDYYEPVPDHRYKGIRVPATLSATHEEMQVKSTNYTAVIVTDYEQEDRHLIDMIVRFRRVFPFRTKVVNIRSFAFKSGCTGCLGCIRDGICVLDDGFQDFLRNEVFTGSAVVYACRLQSHSLGWFMKQFEDRQFCNRKRNRNKADGYPVGYLISGDFRYEVNLRTALEERAAEAGSCLCGIATDEQDTDQSIDKLASVLAYVLEEGCSVNSGSGEHSKKHPKESLREKMYLSLAGNKTISKRFRKQIDEGMTMAYKKAIRDH